MELWIGIVLIVVYFMIGIFFAELFHEPGCSGDFSLILIPLWPLAIVIIMLGCVVAIPSKLAHWVRKFL